MNLIITTLLLAAGATTDAEISMRLAATTELNLIPAQARLELNRDMTREVRQQLKLQMEQKTAAALVESSEVLLAGEPNARPAKKK